MFLMKKIKNAKSKKIKLRKNLNADALFRSVKEQFSGIADHRTSGAEISLADALMSGFAVFSLKDPSLLAFEQRRAGDSNLNSIFNINTIPSDTRMREILDEVEPGSLRPPFTSIFRELQRGKALEPMVFMNGCYLLSLDGTGYYSSEKISSESCMEKKHKKSGKTTFYRQMLGAAIIHPEFKEVIPLAPEMIIKQDGETKNDCERNAAKRFFSDLRREHPHLPLIVTEDGLSSNAPHIKNLRENDLHYILGVKPGDHGFLFQYVNDAAAQGSRVVAYACPDKENPRIRHEFRFINGVPLNQSNQDILVNFVEYWESTPQGRKHFSWITDFTITQDNVCQIMRGGRARWKIENETFNTLKNQGYNFGHNYGLGKKHLSTVFVQLMMLAFLVDQAQQLACKLFKAAWKKCGSKRELWEHARSLFKNFRLGSMQELYRAILHGYEKQRPVIIGSG